MPSVTHYLSNRYGLSRQWGFSLVEALVSLLITLVVLGMVFRTAQMLVAKNTAGLAANLEGELVSAGEAVTVSHAEHFQEGDKVLLTQTGGFAERAEVTDVGESALAFRSLDSDDGELIYEYLPGERRHSMHGHSRRRLLSTSNRPALTSQSRDTA